MLGPNLLAAGWGESAPSLRATIPSQDNQGAPGGQPQEGTH